VYTWVRRSFYCDGTGQALQCVRQEKLRTCVPHLCDVSNGRRFWVHRSVTVHNSYFPNIGAVAIISTDVTLTKESLDSGDVKMVTK
jgi:hypothetical protein